VAATRLRRLGILCAWLYVVVFIGSQVLLSLGEQLPLDPKQSIALREQAVLRYWHLHIGLIVFGSATAVIGFLLLAGVAWAIYDALRAQRQTLARLTLVVGLAGLALSAVAAIVQGTELASLADRLVHASTATARTTVIQEYDNAPASFVALYLLGIEAVAAWLGLVGVTLLQHKGRSSVAGWASLAACLLEGLGLPVLVAWVLGAAVGLWRLNGSDNAWLQRLGLGRLMQPVLARATPAPEEEERAPGQSARLDAAQGSKAGAGQTRLAGSVAGGSGMTTGVRTGAARRRRRKR
jgi:hypothetical protein